MEDSDLSGPLMQQRIERMKFNLRIYLRLVGASLQAQMEYKTSFLFRGMTVIIFYGCQFALIGLLLHKFKHINNWRLEEVAFLYGMLILAHGMNGLFLDALTIFDDHIVEGTFDRFLIRPVPPFMQVISSRVEVTTAATFLLGLATFVVAAYFVHVRWTPGKVLFLPVVLVGAAMIQAGIRMTLASAAFWTVRSRPLFHLILYSTREFLWYPLSIYQVGVQVVFTLVLPLAFMNYYPSQYFLDKQEFGMFHPVFQFLTPVVGVLCFIFGIWMWRRGIQNYQSTGS